MARAEGTLAAPQGLGGLIQALRRSQPGGLIGLLVLLAVLVLLFSLLVPGRFASVGTLQSIMFQLPELGLLALAMAVPLISGGLNLAIIATTNQTALLMAFVMKSLIAPEAAGLEVALGVIAALGAGLSLALLIGLATGAVVAFTGVHPILVTLGTMSIIDGVSIWLTRGTVIAGFPAAFQVLGNGTLGGVPIPFLLFLAAAGLVGLILKRTPFGVAVHMIGSNLEATRYSGIDTRRVLVGVYVLSSGLCFLAACLMMARFNSASAGYAQSYLLVTILAAVLGGIDPFGGFGRVAGLVVSLLILQTIASGFNLLGLSQHLTLAIWGLTLIGVMAAKTGFTQLRAWLAARAPLPPARPSIPEEGP